jgi:DNA-binding transcriptional regulator YdaS (Cro superfamily)
MRRMKTITSMKNWMAVATVAEQETLAARVGTTRGMLYQYAGAHRTASAERAGAIERATAEMHKASKGRLPKIYRTDLSEACLQCEYAQRCLKGQAIVSEFPIVDARQLEMAL